MTIESKHYLLHYEKPRFFSQLIYIFLDLDLIVSVPGFTYFLFHRFRKKTGVVTNVRCRDSVYGYDVAKISDILLETAKLYAAYRTSLVLTPD